MIIADTSALVALYSESGVEHDAVVKWLLSTEPMMVVSPYVVAELDYLISTRVGVAAELGVLAELSAGAYELPHMKAADVKAARRVVKRYEKMNIGITDASLVVLAHRYRTRTILTLDHKHFRVMRPLFGGHFKIVP